MPQTQEDVCSSPGLGVRRAREWYWFERVQISSGENYGLSSASLGRLLTRKAMFMRTYAAPKFLWGKLSGPQVVRAEVEWCVGNLISY